jgi:NAD+ kinase
MSKPHSTPTSMPGSPPPSPEPVRRAFVLTHGRAETIGPALERVQATAAGAGVELLYPDEERAKHGLPPDGDDDSAGADLAVVLGGDGTMLRALARFLDLGLPVIGVNFGRVGFLASIEPDRLEPDLARVFAGDYTVVELPTLDTMVGADTAVAVNDVVAASSSLGRMVELEWGVGGEDLGRQPCDGLICSTPSGSTAYNLSNGGPVLVWGLDALALTFVAAHSLHVRPLVVPRGRDVVIWNRTPDVAVSVLVDGHVFHELPPDGRVTVRLGERRSLLATLPEATFFRRYRETFGP